ncbi:D-inositol-3-phosphate glycosyltransferase [Dermacoccaceae bacterium W4C1]
MSNQPAAQVRRIAMISVHTSPLAQPGQGDAGGMNVYVLETGRQLAAMGIEVEIFTRRTSAAQPQTEQVAPGLLVRHVDAGPYEGLGKDDLPGQLCAFTAGMMQVVASHPPGYFDLVHSHYWLSGQVGWLVAARWDLPLVHSMHTMARVKNAGLAQGDDLEPGGREIGEEQVVAAATRLVANTDAERGQLIDLYGADPQIVRVIHPGVDLDTFTPGETSAARARLGLDPQAQVLVFAGRIQPLKGPEVLLRAAALLRADPQLAETLQVVLIGAPSGSGLREPQRLERMVGELGLSTMVRFLPPVGRAELADWYRAADLVVMPSYNESFGLVAVEAAACGTPTVAADVGGLPAAVGDGGVLVRGHDPADWAAAIAETLADESGRERLSQNAIQHACTMGWDSTAQKLATLYREAVSPPEQTELASVEVGDGERVGEQR